MIRYVQRRLEGHAALEAVTRPALRWLQGRLQRPAPDVSLPSLGKGQQDHPFGAVTYTESGRPEADQSRAAAVPTVASVQVQTSSQLTRAFESATAGDIVEIAPGDYQVATPMSTVHAGEVWRPIVVRAARPGTVTLHVHAVQAVVVSQPFWVIENITWRGECARQEDCEHAFHVVGRAHSTVLRNNRLEDFNAHIKVNGEEGRWPDDGLVEFNTLTNTGPRHTDRPVTLIDIVAADGWQISDNLITGFVKDGGNGVSYGMFMKGGGRGGRFERNLVICTPRAIDQPGLRVGMSLGGGGSDPQFCRDARCNAEHTDGLIVNNVVGHCNDFGIDLWRAPGSTVMHNTLVNTAGIDVRAGETTASVVANVLDGRLRARNGASAAFQDNVVTALPTVLQAPDRLQLRWTQPPGPVGAGSSSPAATDFCNDRTSGVRLPGAMGARPDCVDRSGDHPAQR